MRIYEEYLALGELWVGSDNYCLLSLRRVYDDLCAEIREHLKEKIEFGNLTLVEEDSRAVWGWTAIESSLADIR